MTDPVGGGWAGWASSLGDALRVAGGTILALGASALVALLLGCDRGIAAAAVVPLGLALAVWVVAHGSGPAGVAAVLRRLLGVTVGAGLVAGGVFAALGWGLGSRMSRPSGALALMSAGLLVAIAGRLPQRPREAGLVTANEWAATDDAVVVGVVTLLAAAGTVGADVGPLVAPVIDRLDAVSAPVLGVLLLVVVAAPCAAVAALVSAPRGRSPVARGLVLAALAAALGAGLMHVAGTGLEAVAETTTMIDDRMAARADAWRAGLAVGAVGAWVGAVVASLVSLGAGIRARAHGVLHDQQQRRLSVLLVALLCSSVLVLVCARLQTSLSAPWSIRPALSAGVFASVGVMAIHMGVAALGDVSSPLQHRAGGYVASATVSSVVAVLLAALAASFAALCRVRVDSPFDWLGAAAEAAQARRLVFASGASFVLPVLAAAVVGGHGRGGRRWAMTAARHLAAAVLLASVALLLAGVWVTGAREEVVEPWNAVVPRSLELAGGTADRCQGLHHARLLAVDESGVHQGGERLGDLEELDHRAGCERIARLVKVTHRALTLAVDERVKGRALSCLLRAISASSARTPEHCSVQLVARDAAGVPRCAEGTLGTASCFRGPAPQLIHLHSSRVVVDVGPGPARIRQGRFPEDSYLWESGSFGAEGLALWPSDDTSSGNIVSLWHRLRARMPDHAPLVYSLPGPPTPADDEAAAKRRVEVSLAATVRGEETVARAIERRLSDRRVPLARCHRVRDEPATQVSASYRGIVDRGGRLAGVMAAGGQATAAAARCVAATLSSMRLPASLPTLVVIEVHLHERAASPPLPLEDELPATL